MLKVLYIIPSLKKGGAERLVLDICIALQKLQGIQVKLIVFSELNDYSFLTESIDWEVIPSSVQLRVIGRNTYNIDKLQAAIEDFSPDIIHTHLFETEIVSRICYYPHAKWFTHCHGNMSQFKNLTIKTIFNKRQLTNYYEKRFLFQAYNKNGGTNFLAISKHTQKYFEKTTKKYSIIFFPNAINYSKFCITKSKQINSDTILRLINIGSFQDKKNQLFLIEVANELRNRKVKFSLHLLGDGANFLKVKENIIDNNLENDVFLCGNVDKVESYLSNADIYVHSATYEPSGLVLLEAMAAGLPVVTLDGKGNRDLIVEGKNGYMVYEQNVKIFTDKIIEIWENKELYKTISNYAQDFARQYDIKQYVDRLLVLYNDKIISTNS